MCNKNGVCKICRGGYVLYQGKCKGEYLSRLSYVLVRNKMHMWSQYYIVDGHLWSIPWKVKAEKMSISLLKHIIYIVYTIMYMFLPHGCIFNL